MKQNLLTRLMKRGRKVTHMKHVSKMCWFNSQNDNLLKHFEGDS